jgi:hypothetical protein
VKTATLQCAENKQVKCSRQKFRYFGGHSSLVSTMYSTD